MVPSLEKEAANDDTTATPGEEDSFLQQPDNQEDVSEPAATDMKEYRMCKRLRLDLPYRRRFIHTLWLFWAFFGMGWLSGQKGPAFPDLRQIAHQDLDVASWIFSADTFGMLVGSLIGGYMYDHFNRLLLICFSIITMATCSVALPWCTNFHLMVAVVTLISVGAGGLHAGGNVDLVSMWDEEGRPLMQALHFCFGVGGIISPVVTEPFLAVKTSVPAPSKSASDQYQFGNDTTSASVLFTTNQPTSNISTYVEEYGETHLKYAYMITGILLFSSAVPFFVMYLLSTAQIMNASTDMNADKSKQKRPAQFHPSFKLVLISMIGVLMFTYSGVETTFSPFLTTFSIRHLNWTKSQGSYATSLLWFSFSLGRFFGIFLIQRISPAKMLFGFFLMLTCSLIGFLASSVVMNTDLVLVFVAFTGFSLSVVFPCMFTWIEESLLEITGLMASFFITSSCTGGFLMSLLIGFLMDNFVAITFAYVLLITSCISFMLFLVILRKHVQSFSPSSIEKDIRILPKHKT